jgi:adenylate cyclase
LPPGGAEVPATLLFADVRGSTGLAERTDAAGFAARLRQFYATSSQAIIDEQGLVDKFVGDEIVAIFIPAFNGPHHAVAAIRAAVNMLRATGYGTAEGAPLMIGIGINTGPAFIGTVAVGSEVTDFTALGDTVNVAARLAAEAAGGEVLISDATAEASGLGLDGIPHRQIPLRGHAAPVALRVAGYEALAALSPA